MDGGNDAKAYHRFGLQVTHRNPRTRAYGNWLLAMWELFLRNPQADRYAIFQDDLVMYRNLRSYLDAAYYPEKGYLNLYSFPVNEAVADGQDYVGWYKSNQKGQGAVALVFDADAVDALLNSRMLFTAARKKKQKGGRHKNIDGKIANAMKNAGWMECVHSPGLVQHIGEKSVAGNGRHLLSETFRGEEFDALELG